MVEAAIGVIGGSGLYDIEGLADRREVRVQTPFGDPSDHLVIGTLDDVSIAFLPRHGRGHRVSPTEIPARANIYALKSIGVQSVISISAVGSLREHLKPLDLVIPDQLIDRTRSRPSTFFGQGLVVHVGFADPFCDDLRRVAIDAAGDDTAIHDGGTYVAIEGPQFSTRAESAMHRSWGASVVGMTALPEARLAREAELCYLTLAFVTDYDVWRQDEEDVSVELVIKNLNENVRTAQSIIQRMTQLIPESRACACGSALETAIITIREVIPTETLTKVGLLVNKYLD